MRFEEIVKYIETLPNRNEIVKYLQHEKEVLYQKKVDAIDTTYQKELKFQIDDLEDIFNVIERGIRPQTGSSFQSKNRLERLKPLVKRLVRQKEYNENLLNSLVLLYEGKLDD